MGNPCDENLGKPQAHPRAVVLTTLLFALWCCYSLNGFRSWQTPIQLSDADAGSGIRQALFAGSALVAVLVLWHTRTAWSVIRSQWRLALLAAWLVLSAAYSDLPGTSLKRALLFVCGSVTACAVVAVAADPIRHAGRLLALLPAAAAWMSILWFAAFPAAITTNPGRPGLAGISNHPNTLAPALAIGLVMSLGIGLPGRAGTAVKALAVAGCVTGLLMTISITSIGLAIVSLSVLGLILLPPYWKALAAIGAFGSALAVFLYGTGRVKSALLDGAGRDESMSGRAELWDIVRSEISQAPVFGRGWGAFWTEGKGRALVGTWNPRQSHNAYFDVLLDLGIVGLILFAVLVIPPMRSLARRAHRAGTGEERATAAAMIATICGLLFVYSFQQSFLGKVDSFVFAAVLLICVAASTPAHRTPFRSPDPQHAAEQPADPGSS